MFRFKQIFYVISFKNIIKKKECKILLTVIINKN